MSITDFIIWNNLINNSAPSEPIELSPAFETFIQYILIGIAGTVVFIVIAFLAVILWGAGVIAWDWLKQKYHSRK